MKVLNAIGAVAIASYGLSCFCIGRKKTNAYVRAIPAAISCLPELIIRQVDKCAPFPEHQNIFTKRRTF